MGMYTELCIGVEFKKETPSDVIAVISIMATGDNPFVRESIPESVRGHKLLSVERPWILQSGGSYYFDAKPCLVWQKDTITDTYFLTVWTNIKNYSGEWEAFLEFIAPWLETQGFIGHYRYEECDEPTLLYSENGTIRFRKIESQVQP